MEIISREEAIAQGLKKYFTNKPFRNGHVCERRVANNSCIMCSLARTKKYRQTEKGRAKSKEDAKLRWADKEQRAKQLEARKNWAKENPERIKELKRKDWWKHHFKCEC